jgi:hypothetical protein
MTQNPYESPSTDTSPVDWAERKARFKEYLWDRLTLLVVGTVLCCTLVFGLTALCLFLERLGLIAR